MKRYKHGLSHYKLATFDMGQLVPLTCYDVLPGDSIQQSTSVLIRLSPQLAPVMHPVKVQVHHWFVPYRILWAGWEDFITGKSATPPPILDQNPGGGYAGVLDYLGVPPDSDVNINGFNLWAYNLIWNEFYRDQDLQAERTSTDNTLAPVAWDKDYFTTARPWPQKGPEVTLPIGVSAPVISAGGGPVFKDANGVQMGLDAEGGNVTVSNARFGSAVNHVGGSVAWDTPNLIADLTNATAVNVNEVRRAFAIQRYQEARALYGSRYTEYLAYLGVRSSDARLQRPEYLGGGKATISFSEVLQTGEGTDADNVVGTMRGHGISAMRSRRFRKYFEEHGVVMTLCSVRPKSIYATGLHRSWLRQEKEQYWQKELEHIGQQAIANHEVFASGGQETWGYGDRYSEYRSIPSTIAGEFRTDLNYWHLARQFVSTPTLNADFIECDPGKRIFAEQTKHSLWVMAAHSVQSRRMVANTSVGRII